MSNKLGGCRVLGSWSFMVSSWAQWGVARSGSVVSHDLEPERQGLRRCHALGFVVSHGEHNGAGRVSRGSGPW